MTQLKKYFEELRSALALHGQAEADARRAFYNGASAVLETVLRAPEEDVLATLELCALETRLHFVQEKRKQETARAAEAAAGNVVFIDDTPVDFLTIRFWRDKPGPLCPNPPPPDQQPWCAQVGPNIAEGVGGFGPTPLMALHELLENIAKNEGYKSDLGKLLIR